MTASLSSPYALVGESQPSQEAHHKGLPPAYPHLSSAVVVPAKPAIQAKPPVKLEQKTPIKVEPRKVEVPKPAENPDGL